MSVRLNLVPNILVLDYRLTQWQPLYGTYVHCQRKVLTLSK